MKIVSLNVCGLTSKVSPCVLEDYIQAFDIICLSETKAKIHEMSEFSNFKAINPSHKEKSHKYHGIHGMCILVKEYLQDHIKEIKSKHNSSQWIEVSNPQTKSSVIIGSVYIPHEKSKYFDENTFDKLQDDLTTIQASYPVSPILLVGDFNSRTSNDEDLLPCVEENTPYELGDNSVICAENHIINAGASVLRHNEDSTKNSNGAKLLGFCKATGLIIINGRCGLDKGVGKYTFSKENQNSTIDYALIQPTYIKQVKDFYIDQFDPCLSDAHHPLCIEIYYKHSDNSRTKSGAKASKTKTRVAWDSNMKTHYSRLIDIRMLEKLGNDIAQLQTAIPDQKSIDQCVSILKNILVTPARRIGIEKKIRYNPNNEQKVHNKPWFDSECKQRRKAYYKSKKILKRKCEIKELRARAKLYRNFMRQKSNAYYNKLHKQLRHAKYSTPKEYWRIINGTHKQCSAVDINEFFKHFKDLSESDEGLSSSYDIPNDVTCNEEINKAVTTEEILSTIKKLKNHKACGLDNILNEYFKNCPPIMFNVLEVLFNTVLNSGIIPTDWTLGVIIPLHKKGTISDPNNYRGITLLSCLGKLFTALLNKRLNDYMENNNLLGLEQAGFRAGYSTIDHIFTLNNLIEFYIQNNKRLYCAFVDYSKAFDLVDRASLWYKVLEQGINGNVLRVVKNMYENAKSCLKVNDEISETFNCNIGVRQGENLSPLLFAIYLNDFRSYLDKECKGTIHIANSAAQLLKDPQMGTFLKLYVLLYADDTILIAESANDLQNSLNALHDYCTTWKLYVNMDKTNIVVFSKGKVTKLPEFKYGDATVTIAHCYTYLGVVMKYNKNFDSAVDKQVTQANRALNNLLVKASRLKLPADIILSLYNTLVVPVLLYGSEIWGVGDISKIELFERKFMKRLLKVSYQTPTCMVYAELGIMPVKYLVKQRILNYWCRILTSDTNKLSFMMYKLMACNIQAAPPKQISAKWMNYVKDALSDLHLTDIWNNPPVSQEDRADFKALLKVKYNSHHMENVLTNINEDKRCQFYRTFKNNVEFERYLTKLNSTHCESLTKWRCGDNLIPSNNYKFGKKDRRMKLATCVNQGKEEMNPIS